MADGMPWPTQQPPQQRRVRFEGDPEELTPSLLTGAAEETPPSENDDYEPRGSNDPFLQVDIPMFVGGFGTFAYNTAMSNRIRNHKLIPGGEYDVKKYAPTFLHDCLMIPGSLANIMEKDSAISITHRMTPALLPGFNAYVNKENGQPCLLTAEDPTAYVQGMLIFGQGSSRRDLIHEHYRSNTRRVKADVEIDVVVPVDVPNHGKSHGEMLQRRRISAHIWLWSKPQSMVDGSRWTLEDYLRGDYPFEPRVFEPVNEDAGVGDHEDDLYTDDHANFVVKEPEDVDAERGTSVLD